jgi:NADH dehydrogenase
MGPRLKTILVAGATGRLGLEIVRLLRGADHPVRALVRPDSAPARRDALADCGAELVVGDLKDAASIRDACRDAGTVVSTATAAMPRRPDDSIQVVDGEGQLRLVEAAASSGAGHFVFISFPPVPIDFALQRAKRAVEDRLRQVRGMTYTILQPSKFFEVWLSPLVGFDPAHGKARVFGTGERPVSWISLFDVARCVAAAAVEGSGGAAAGRVIPLGGAEPLSPLQVIGAFDALTGRRTEVERLHEQALQDRLRVAADPLSETHAALALGMAGGQLVDSSVADSVFPWPRASVADYVRRVLGSQPQQ